MNLRFPAPAKINLLLRITHQRSDGYHELQTIFQFIDLCDYLEFHILNEPIIQLTYHPQSDCYNALKNVPVEHNLCYRTAQYLQHIAPSRHCGVHIILQKNIPIGAGLGGGSSNAATTLLALNHIWNLQLTTQEILQIGLQFGADVPVFIQGQSVWAEGIGEIFYPIEPPEIEIGLLCPELMIPTHLIFQSPHLVRHHPPLPRTEISQMIALNQYNSNMNDCCEAIYQHFPVMHTLIQRLAPFQAHVTGTGSAIFLKQPPSSSEIQKILHALPISASYDLVHTTNQSPLLPILRNLHP